MHSDIFASLFNRYKTKLKGEYFAVASLGNLQNTFFANIGCGVPFKAQQFAYVTASGDILETTRTLKVPYL